MRRGYRSRTTGGEMTRTPGTKTPPDLSMRASRGVWERRRRLSWEESDGGATRGSSGAVAETRVRFTGGAGTLAPASAAEKTGDGAGSGSRGAALRSATSEVVEMWRMTERGDEANDTHDAATPNADQGTNSKALLDQLLPVALQSGGGEGGNGERHPEARTSRCRATDHRASPSLRESAASASSSRGGKGPRGRTRFGRGSSKSWFAPGRRRSFFEASEIGPIALSPGPDPWRRGSRHRPQAQVPEPRARTPLRDRDSASFDILPRFPIMQGREEYMNAGTPACRGVLGDRAVRRVGPSFFQETEQPKRKRFSQDKARGCREGPNAEPPRKISERATQTSPIDHHRYPRPDHPPGRQKPWAHARTGDHSSWIGGITTLRTPRQPVDAWRPQQQWSVVQRSSHTRRENMGQTVPIGSDEQAFGSSARCERSPRSCPNRLILRTLSMPSGSWCNRHGWNHLDRPRDPFL